MTARQVMCIGRARIARAAPLGLAALAIGTALPAPAVAQQALADLSDPVAYERCLAHAKSDPEEAFEDAIAWRDAGGGPGALHCTALSLVGLGQFEEAAGRLEDLAQSMKTFAPAARADVLGQAARAWLSAGRATRAFAAASAGLALDPDNVELIVDRSEVLASAANYWEALDDLNRALELDPDQIDALIFRATAYRYVDALDLSRDDLSRALAMAPGNVDALVERGIVRRLDGDDVGARADWLRVLELAPTGAAADNARANLARLDVRVE